MMFLLVLMMVGVCKTWGQTDYSGTYYIANMRGGYDGNNISSNYYLCPTEGWAFYVATNNVQAGDNGQPFLTTYQCRKGSDYYDATMAVWNVEKDPSSGCYYIKQAKTGRYMVSNGGLPDAGFTRARVHLETVANSTALATIGDMALFEITYDNSTANYPDHYDIIPHSTAGRDGNNIYLTVNTNNYNYLYGTDAKKNGPRGFKNCGGIIGLYTHPDDGNTCFYLENALSIGRPIITNNFNGTFTISAATGATIYYTTDGSEPTTSTTTTGTTSVTVSQTADISVIKAIAKAAADGFPTVTTTYNLPRCERPVISVSGTTATLTCSTPNVSFLWTNNPDATPETSCTSPFDIGNNSVIKVIARKQGYIDSYPAYYTQQVTVHSTDEMNMIGNFLLADDFVVNGTLGSESNPFVGIIDGQYHTISGLSHALVAYANGATIKNVVLDNVGISSGTNVGAICNEADGDTKIYNCGVLSGSVSGSGNVGGLVGLIKSGSSVRVVNCYNFATVSGSTMAGIVGNNEGTVGDVRIAMCMMYGDMPGGTSPVYAGNHLSNISDFTEYNYYRSKANISYSDYNDQLAIDKDEYLSRFPFYRHILNTHRELASYFLFGDYSEDHVSEIGHWVLKKGTDAPKYPVVEAWRENTKTTPYYISETDNNYTPPPTTDDYTGKLLTGMGTSGYLSVIVKISADGMDGGTAIEQTIKLPITDMNISEHDYTYGKVILPFANEIGTWTPNYDKICTGWKITNVGGEQSYSATNYNFADRTNKNKDIYDATNNPYIFAQGGYYIVPTGVTSITIEANFATAYYLSDATYDVGYGVDYTGPTGLGGNTHYTENGFHGKTIYNNIVNALAAMGTSSNPHTQAIVLVGNYHFPTETPTGTKPENNNPIANYTGRAFTLMSIDEDNNQEPDYAWYSNGTFNRPAIAPVRFDFVALIPLGMSSHVENSKGYPGVPIWKPRGWFEITETGLSIMHQFELDDGNFGVASSINNRCVINGGYFTQMVRANEKASDKLTYYKIGGNAYIKEFYPGNHSAKSYAVTLAPINVTGGEIEQCFMTGFGKGTAIGANIYFWCCGGKIHKFLGAYMEKPKQTANSDGTVNLTAKIDHALIGRFYGGGTSAKANITGAIDITIDNSRVDFYCGGPEFSSASYSPSVKTTANNTVFGEFYGAGFGGTSITYSGDVDDNNIAFNDIITPYPTSPFSDFYINSSNATGKYGRLRTYSGYGIGTCYKFEFINHSYFLRGVARFYTGYAQFSLATTGNVINELNNCKIKRLPAATTIIKENTSGDFYGAGCQGMVNGTVTSTLTGCQIDGSAFGGGYKAESNEVKVYTTMPPEYSSYNRETGIFSDFGDGTYDIYNWGQGDATTENTVSGTTLYTSKDVTMSDLGNVTGAISLTIDGGSVGAENDNNPNHGNVYGGGNESKSLNNTTVTLKGSAHIYGNVFGGGNEAEVRGSATVNITQ